MHASRPRGSFDRLGAVPLLIVGAVIFVASCGGDHQYALPSAPTLAVASTGRPAFFISGTISEVTSTGLTPLADAQVSALDAGATTNAQGFYTLSSQKEGPLQVTVTKSGYKSETRTARFPGTATQVFFDVEIVRETDIHALSGRVSALTSAGLLMPVEDVEVSVMSCNAVSKGCLYNIFQSVKTDRSGSYRFQGLYAGKNNFVWAAKDGYDVVGPPPLMSCDYCNAIVTLEADTQFDIRLIRR